MPTDTPWWEEFRDLMPVTRQWAYFDHAAVAPLSTPVADALTAWTRDSVENGAVHWSGWRERVEAVRQLGAELIGADESEIAIVRNTTEGVTLVAEGVRWQPGDNVVVPAGEFPSNRLPWENLADRGVELRVVPNESEHLDLDRLESYCDERTRIVSVSWVGYATGWRNDLETLAVIAHRHGAKLFVDAIQGLGVLPLDVSTTGIDFLSADSHKWLLGPEGAGLFFARRECLKELRPFGLGWNSVERPGNFDATDARLKQSAARYEGGTYNMAGVAGLEAALRLVLRFGIAEISARLLEVTDRLCQRLESECGAVIVSQRDTERRSGIVAFDLPGCDLRRVRRSARDAGVVLNVRGGHLRVSPHVYTNDADVDRLMVTLQARN
jgi:cysteine desulfurase/selenocysteine lyase